MKISAFSKFRFDDTLRHMGVTPENVNTFKNKYFISISHSTVFDADDDMDGEWMPMFRESSDNVLVILFDDVINEAFNTMGAKAMTDEQADTILEFLSRIQPSDDTELIVHCAMGSSRSVAVAEFAASMFGERPEFITARIDRKANPLVLGKLHKAKLRKHENN